MIDHFAPQARHHKVNSSGEPHSPRRGRPLCRWLLVHLPAMAVISGASCPNASSPADVGGFADASVSPPTNSTSGRVSASSSSFASGGHQSSSSFYDPSCHSDCLFDSYYCSDGGVFHAYRTVVPCGVPPPCPSYLHHTCPWGCLRWPFTLSDSPGDLCAPEPNQPGDQCSVDGGCYAGMAELLPDGGTQKHYLSCDPATSTCVTTGPPDAGNYGSYCGVRVVCGQHPFVSIAPQCTGGLCLVAYKGYPENCLAELCTLSCTSDSDCPQGSICTWLPSLEQWSSTLIPICAPSRPVGCEHAGTRSPPDGVM